jgi:hypothetical protein
MMARDKRTGKKKQKKFIHEIKVDFVGQRGQAFQDNFQAFTENMCNCAGNSNYLNTGVIS